MTVAAQWRKSSIKWKYRKVYSMHSFDIPDVKWVERYVVGISHPVRPLTPAEIDKQMAEVNQALKIGKLIGIEQNFTLMQSGNKDIITQYTVYHVGFKHRPPGK